MTRKSLSPMQRLAVWERNAGLCHLCGRKIRAGEKWDVSHDRPLGLLGEDGGDNLKVAHRACHSIQTREIDVPAIARAKRRKAKHAGIRKQGGFQTNRDGKFKQKIGGTVVLR